MAYGRIPRRLMYRRAKIESSVETIDAQGEPIRTWTVTAVQEPCVVQPMTDKLREAMGGAMRGSEFFLAFDPTAPVALDDRITVGSDVLLVGEVVDAAGTAHHLEVGASRWTGA